MSLQTYFKEFNKVIKMDYDVKSELKEKRDILLGILRNDDDMPAFDEYNQGSYSVKESRGQPKSGALKQATCKGNF